jgi:preprotein translocase subunit SecE
VNRQTKRLLQRQGQLGADGTPAPRRPPATLARRPPEARRASLGKRFAQFMREVRSELAKVIWPRRAEVVNYSTVVLTTLVLLSLLIFGLNYLFAKGVLFLYRR